MGTCSCTLCSLACTLNFHYENLKFDLVKGHVRDPPSNSILLLTSSVYVPSFIILRLIVFELCWKQTDRQTDGQRDIQDNRIKHFRGILHKLLRKVMAVGCNMGWNAYDIKKCSPKKEIENRLRCSWLSSFPISFTFCSLERKRRKNWNWWKWRRES